MTRKTMTLGLCGLWMVSAPTWAADWPNFLGPNGKGIAPDTGINKDWSAKQPQVVWTVQMGAPSYAGPAVAGGRVFIIDHKGTEDVVRAFALTNGNEVWSYSYPEAAAENCGFARSTPTISDGKVYTMSRFGLLNCLEAKTGTLIWKKNIVAEFNGSLPGWQMAVSPQVDGDKLIVCPGGRDAAVAALNKTTGATIWKGGGSDKPGYATPVPATIGGKKQYVVFTGVALIGVDAADGKLLWRLPWQTSYDVNAATPIVTGDTVFITTGYGHGCALVKTAGENPSIIWQSKEIQAHFSSPILKDGYIYGNSDPGRLVCLDAKTGEAKWQAQGFEKGGIVAVDGTIIALVGNSGDLVMAEMSSARYKELSRMKAPLGGQSWTAPIVADGKLIIRNKATLACINLK